MRISKFKIFWAELGESGKHIQSGMRPVLVLGNDKANRFSDVVTVLPISSKIEKAETIPTHIVLESGLKKESVILPEQIRTIPKSWLKGGCVYMLNKYEEDVVKNAVIKQLGFA